jgi:hypothetical protein
MRSFVDYYFEVGYDQAQEFEKTAGAASEAAGAIINPLNILGGNLMAGLLGYGYGEKGEADQISDDAISGGLANILVPGLGPYRLGKRLRDTMDTNREIRKQHLKKLIAESEGY